MGNNAVYVNGNYVNGGADVHINEHGSDWYYAVCALMGVTTLALLAMSVMNRKRSEQGMTDNTGDNVSYRNSRSNRSNSPIFYYITAGINMVATIAYFSMGSNLGWTPVTAEFQRSNSHVAGFTREVFYVRYIDWAITTPLLLMDLMLTAGFPWSSILFTCLVDEVMIICGLVGALVPSRYKWGFFAFGCAALLFIVYQLAVEGIKRVKQLSKSYGMPENEDASGRNSAAFRKIERTYMMCAVWTLLLWMCYPIAWGLCEGANVIGADGEAIFYGILDLLAKPVFSIMLIVGHLGVDTCLMGLNFRNAGEPFHHHYETGDARAMQVTAPIIVDNKNTYPTHTQGATYPTQTQGGNYIPYDNTLNQQL